jgi:hypothetical protein
MFRYKCTTFRGQNMLSLKQTDNYKVPQSVLGSFFNVNYV